VVELKWPGILRSENVNLPSDIDMADISAIQELVKIGQSMAAGLDWTKLLG